MSKVEQFFEIAKTVGLVKNGKYIDGIPKGKSKDINSFYRLEDSLGYPQPDDMAKQEQSKQLKVGDSTNCFLGAVIRIPIEPHFAGSYRLEYDSKYITLFGKDKNYEGFRFSDDQPIWYEEMVLISCVLEIRKATPTIKEVTSTEIVVDLGCV